MTIDTIWNDHVDGLSIEPHPAILRGESEDLPLDWYIVSGDLTWQWEIHFSFNETDNTYHYSI